MTPVSIKAECVMDAFAFNLDGALYLVDDEAFKKFLNHIRIPTKYIERCMQDEDGRRLAEETINYWLQHNESFNFLLNDDMIEQIFPCSNAYLPGVKVNDFIIDIFDGDIHIRNHTTDGDMFSATYLTEIMVTIGEWEFQVGVRVLYSDCFNITPRFDGVLFERNTNALLSFPTLGRKFRVASATIDQLLDQIADFIQLSVDGIKDILCPAVKREIEAPHKEKPSVFIRRLCSDLRYSKKVQEELKNQFPTPDEEEEVMSIVLGIATNLVDADFDHIDEVMKRNISIALSHRIVTGESFK